MPTQAEIAEHQDTIDDIVTLALAQLLAEFPSLPMTSVDRLKPAMVELFTELVNDYGRMAAAMGADWYDDLRAQAAVAGSYTAILGSFVTTEELVNTAEWAAAGLYVSPEKVLSSAAGALQRYVAGEDRATITENANIDPAGVRYVRVAQADACAFCVMLATRTGVGLYRSEESALVVGNATYRGRGKSGKPRFRTRNNTPQPAGEKYHDHCRCTTAPVFPGEVYVPEPEVAGWTQLYLDAVKAAGTRSDTSAILAQMRELGGLR